MSLTSPQLPSKQFRDEVEDAVLPYFVKEYPEFQDEFASRLHRIQAEARSKNIAMSPPTASEPKPQIQETQNKTRDEDAIVTPAASSESEPVTLPIQAETEEEDEDAIMSPPAFSESVINEAARTPFRPINFMQTPSKSNSPSGTPTSSPQISAARSRIPRPKSISRLSISSISSISRPNSPHAITIPQPGTPKSGIPRPSTPRRADTAPLPSTPQSSNFRPGAASQASTTRSSISRRNSTTSQASFHSTTSRASFRSSTSRISFRSSISRPVTPRATTSPDPRVDRAHFSSPTVASLARNSKTGDTSKTPTRTPRTSLTPSSLSQLPSAVFEDDAEGGVGSYVLSSPASAVAATTKENDLPSLPELPTPTKSAKSSKLPKVATNRQETIASALRTQRSRPSFSSARKTSESHLP